MSNAAPGLPVASDLYMRILYAVLIIIVGVMVGVVVRKTLFRLLTRFLPKELSSSITKIVYYVVLVIFAVSALGTLGIDLTGLVIAGGVLGIILGFALQSITANIISGVFIFWERPIRPGDLVDINGVLGRVVEINFMSTRIMDLNGTLIRIPNEKVFQSVIRNYGKTAARVLELSVGIAYREDVEKAYRVIKSIVSSHPLVLAKPEPVVFVSELGDSSVNIRVRAWVPSRMYYPVLRDLLASIKTGLQRSGIEIPFPQNDIWFRNKLEVRVVGSEKH